MLQTLAAEENYSSSLTAYDDDQSPTLNVKYYFGIFKRRFFYFLFPFGLISILGLYLAAIQKPIYLSEGKILVESQSFSPELVKLLATTTAGERVQQIQQRILTRENLLSVASKFGLFQSQADILDLMRKNTQFKPIEMEGQLRQSIPTTAFTVGFEYETPKLAMRVASEFVMMFVNEDERSRTSRSTEAVKIISSETKEIEDKLEATQTQITEVSRRPRDVVSDIPEQQKLQMAALASLKAELIQKASIYSEAHPAVIALRKRVASLEKSFIQPPAQKASSTQADDIETLKRQREALEKRLADANARLATARLNEKIDRDQQFGRVQVLESPALPQKPEKSGRLKLIGLGFAAALVISLAAVIAAELLDGSIRSRHQLLGVVSSSLIVSIPYLTSRSDIIRARWRFIIGIFSAVLLLAVLSGLGLAIILGVPLDSSFLNQLLSSFRAAP